MRNSLEVESVIGFVNPFYVIVHAETPIKDNSMRNNPDYKPVISEIEKIMSTPECVMIDDKTPPGTVLPNIPKNRPIFVCGFFKDLCVKEQRDALEKAGYFARIYSPASFEL